MGFRLCRAGCMMWGLRGLGVLGRGFRVFMALGLGFGFFHGFGVLDSGFKV